MTEFLEFKWEDELKTDEEKIAFLEGMVEENDPVALRHAIGIVAKIKGMDEVAKETGLSEKTLCNAFFEDGNPTLSTLTKVLDCLGMRIKLVAKSNSEHEDQAA